jgi:signal peptidase II
VWRAKLNYKALLKAVFMTLSSKKKIVTYYLAAIFFVFLDRVFKIIALHSGGGRSTNIIGEFFKFAFAKNYNIALSLPLAGDILFLLIPAIIFCLLFYSLILIKNKEQDLAGILTVVSFCALSNFYDRVRYGFVVDYFDLHWFSVFNLADAVIVASCLTLFVLYYLKTKKTRSLRF